MEIGLSCGTGFSVFKSIAIKLESGSRFLRTRTGTGVFEKKQIWIALMQALILIKPAGSGYTTLKIFVR
jgi:hypothetical protein